MKLCCAFAAAVFLCCVFVDGIDAQEYTHPQWVYFKDKAAGTMRDAQVSFDALVRRARTFGYQVDETSSAEDLLASLNVQAQRNPKLTPVVDELDIPVAPSYVSEIIALGAHVRATSNWMNAISISCTESQWKRIAALQFVRNIEPVQRWNVPVAEEEPVAVVSKTRSTSGHNLDYGESFQQLDILNVPAVHDIWIDGTGITVGMLDNGFKWRSHEAMRNIHVRGEYDFINKDSLTENETGDPDGQDSHGTVTFSSLAGFKEGVLVGPAFNASFYLAKTEVNATETQVEEDYYAQGLEWLESKGAALTSSSLAYSIFDDGTGYTYGNGDFNGQTAVTTRAAARAARLGVVVVTAMGNNGNVTGTILAPADADSILSVGAITFENQVAGFSSNGPTNDGRIKPDIVTPGVGVFSASRYDTASYTRSNGTSLSTPLAAGVAALVRSARPELTPIQVRDAIRNTADFASNPDNKHGWGKVDAWRALLYNGMVISTNPKVLWDGTRSILACYVISPNPVDVGSVYTNYFVEKGSEASQRMEFVSQYTGMSNGSGLYMAFLPELPHDARVLFDIRASDSKEQRSSPYGAPQNRHSFRVGESHRLGAGNLSPTAFNLGQNYPNPFRISATGATTIRYDVPSDNAFVILALYDALGRRISTLVNGYRNQGMYFVSFNGAGLSTGMYLYALTSGDTSIARRMIMVK